MNPSTQRILRSSFVSLQEKPVRFQTSLLFLPLEKTATITSRNGGCEKITEHLQGLLQNSVMDKCGLSPIPKEYAY